MSFESLGLRPELAQAVYELGFEAPTPIQTRAIPALLEKRDVLGQAQTGTGKTAAFALPILQQLEPKGRHVQALVLTPTRELALQVSQAIESYSKHLNIRVLAVYGGQAYSRQLRALDQGVSVVVGTPGRLIDLIERGALKLNTVQYLVLDEADEMLKMGFVDDVERIMRETPRERQTALFSATMPDPIRQLADRYMQNPLNVSIESKALTVSGTEQRYYMVREADKLAALSRIIEVEDMASGLIFARTKVRTAELAEALISRGFAAEALHGDLSQDVRETVLRRFRNGNVVFLVATDVVARGVDIPSVSHVINYDMPNDPEDYVHRIGRTGRAGREGVAITLVTPRENRWLRTVETYTRQRVTRGTLPGVEEVRAHRDQTFMESLVEHLNSEDVLEREDALVNHLQLDGYDPVAIAAAAIRMARAIELQRPIDDIREAREYNDRDNSSRSASRGGGGGRSRGGEAGMVRFMLDVGREQGIRPADIVGAIAGEASIPGKAIGAIEITRHQTYFDVKEEHAERVSRHSGRGIFMRGKSVALSPAPARRAGMGGGQRQSSRRRYDRVGE